MIDMCLRASNETDFSDAIPWLRSVDNNGAPSWIISGLTWSLDLIGPVEIAPAVYVVVDGESIEVEPAQIDHRFHANLRCMPDIAARVPSEIIVTPSNLRRVFG